MEAGTVRTWIEEIAEQLAGHTLAKFVIETLACFNAPFPRRSQGVSSELLVADSMEAFVADFSDAFEELSRGDWQGEVDEAIAGLFERRLGAVDVLLSTLDDPVIASALRLGLRVRMREIMKTGVWPAIRLRALADFYYSRAVLLMHGIVTLDPERIRQAASETTWKPVTDTKKNTVSLWECHYESDTVWGPQHIRGIKFDLRTYRLATFDLRGEDGGHDALAARLASLGAVAGSSGGFFLYSEPDIAPPSAQYDPVGMLLSGGNLAYPPIEPRAALLFANGQVELRRVGLSDVELYSGEVRIDLSCAAHRSNDEMGPDALSVSLIGDTVFQVGVSLRVPLNGLVFLWHEHYGAAPAPGEKLIWQGPKMRTGERAQEGLSGGPLLVREGEMCIDYQAEGFWGSAAPLTFSQDETGDRNLLARLIVGTDAEGFCYIVAVDGRQANRALGLSLEGCAAWMQGLGCTTAANMDGGSSKRLMLHGAVMDAPTTEVAHAPVADTRTRPVYSGLAVIPK